MSTASLPAGHPNRIPEPHTRDRRDATVRTRCVSKTDLDLKAGAYRLLLCMNYSTGNRRKVLGIT
jgi:hypothetical protein